MSYDLGSRWSVGPGFVELASSHLRKLSRNRAPSELIEPGYAGVSVLTLDGRRVSGILKNESNYSIQILDTEGNFHLFLKRELKELARRKRSLMPAPALSEQELQDLLAFLSRQSVDAPIQESKKIMHGKQGEP
jgi:putative heme-binding domain-containing protein